MNTYQNGLHLFLSKSANGILRKIYRIIVIFLLLVFISCSKDKLPTDEANPDFSPLSVGQFAEYHVERTKYSITSSPEIKHFITRQIISDSFKDVNNQLIYKTDYFALNNNVDWKLDSNSTNWQTTGKMVGQENGQAIVKLIYPLSDGLSWNGNMFNAMDNQKYVVTELGKPYQTELFYFPNTVTIIRQDDSTLLSKNSYTEIYALNVGLIRREKVSLQYCNTPDCLGKGIINSGWKEISTIKNYGK